MMRIFFLFAAIPLLLLTAPLKGYSVTPVMTVTVSIPPMKYFVEKIGGPGISVNVMVPPGADAHSYEPKPSAMVALSRSKLFFTVGLPLEKAWLSRFKPAGRKLTVVQTDAGVEKIPMRKHHHSDNGHEADTGGMDPHIWLAPSCVRHIADTMRDAFITADPDHRERYIGNHRAFIAEIDALDRELKAAFGESSIRTRFLVYHPSWGYFARDYGLEQISIETGGREPKPSDIMRITKEARSAGIRTVFVQPRVSHRSAKVIADAIGGGLVVADPLAENWAANMKAVAHAFKGTLK